MRDLEDKAFVVTGGTRGLGGEITRALLDSGARVVAVYKTDDVNASELADWAEHRYPESLEVVRADVTNRSQCSRVAQRVADTYSAINGLVNNAAVMARADIRSIDPASMLYVLENNVIGLINITQALWEMLTAAEGNSVVNISSSAARTGNPKELIYVASKGAVESITRALARDGARYGLSVNAVAPHLILSGMGEEALASNPTMLSRVPLHRTCDVAEFTSLIQFLLSGQSRYLTGQVLHLNGGRLMMG